MASKVYVPMDKVRVCKRCGTGMLAWIKSEKTGKFYLANVHNQYALAYSPHRCHPDDVKSFEQAKAADLANGYDILYK